MRSAGSRATWQARSSSGHNLRATMGGAACGKVESGARVSLPGPCQVALEAEPIGRREAVAGDEFEEAEGEFGLDIKALGSAEVNTVAVHAEFGIGEAGAEIAELCE